MRRLSVDLKNLLDEEPAVIADYFGGPSVYFHQQAIIEARKGFLHDRHLEMIYAVLPSWGMHRMGKTKNKIVSFKKFKGQIEARATHKLLTKLHGTKTEWNTDNTETLTDIVTLIRFINVSEAGSFLVSSSKTLHHLLPDLVCPIDREYSVRFIKQEKFNDTQIAIGDKNSQLWLAKTYIEAMWNFINEPENNGKLTNYYKRHKNKGFVTSIPKIFDNLVMAYVKRERRKNK